MSLWRGACPLQFVKRLKQQCVCPLVSTVRQQNDTTDRAVVWGNELGWYHETMYSMGPESPPQRQGYLGPLLANCKVLAPTALDRSLHLALRARLEEYGDDL